MYFTANGDIKSHSQSLKMDTKISATLFKILIKNEKEVEMLIKNS